jgi:AraC-like DNA-binding protein
LNKINIHITLNGYIPSLLTGLKTNGINPDHLLQSSYLRKLDLYNPDKYIPNILLDELLTSMSDKLGIDCLAAEFNEHFKATKMGRISRHMYKSPNFLSFLETVIKYQKYVRTNYTARLQIKGSVSRFSVKINGNRNRGQLISEEIDISRILDAFVFVGGERFTPIELGITANSTYHLESIFPKGNYTIKLNQAESWILFNTSLLSKEIPNILEEPKKIELNDYQITEFKIERLLESFKSGTIPKLDEIADMFNVSRRTIERNLQFEGTRFSEIKRRYLQRKSYELLGNDKLSVKEIANQLDYSNSQNFIRTFKSWNGVSPNEYRLML